jgi:hypothetical protein
LRIGSVPFYAFTATDHANRSNRWHRVTVLIPSETDRGRRWLENFRTADSETAQLLLDGLHIASDGDVRSGLLDQLNRLDRHPSVVIPVRSMEDISPYVGAPTRPSRWEAYRHFDPGAPIEVTPGSEGFIGTLVRDLTGGRPSSSRQQWLHPATDLAELRRLKCRSLVFVTDYIGSGTQVTRHVKSFLRHETIRSWRSYGLITVDVVSYAMSAVAVAKIGKYANSVRASIPAASLSTSGWSKAQIDEVRELCLRYTPRSRTDALGFGASAGLYVSTVSSVPNNIPWVLRRPSSTSWASFFQDRLFPDDLRLQLSGYHPVPDLPALVKATGQLRLATSIGSGRHSTTAVQLLCLLALAYRQPGVSAQQAAHSMSLGFDRANQLMTFLHDNGFLSADHRLTRLGFAEIHASRRLVRGYRSKVPDQAAAPYYPGQLR